MTLHGVVKPRERILLALLLVVFSASGLFDHSLWTPNDSREGGMIAEMYRSGAWTSLSLNGEPFLEKPPLLHWTAVILCTLLGHVNEGWIRVPAALFGLATALIVWVWGRRLGRERAGILAAFLCVTNITFFEYSRIVLTDICLTFAVVVSLHLFFSAYSAEKARLLRYALFLLAASLSFYAKGLVGPVFIMGSVVVFLAIMRRFALAFLLSLVFAPLLVAAVCPWAAALYREGGREYLISAFIDNQLGRFFKLSPGAPVTSLPLVGRWLGFMADRPVPLDPYFAHKEPLYHYLVKLPVRLLPWTLLTVPAVGFWYKRRSTVVSPFATLLRCSLATIIVILHLSSSKAGAYLLPAFPILFLMVGVWCEDLGATGLARLDASMIALTSGLVRVLSFALPSLYLILFALPPVAFARLATAAGRLGAPLPFGDASDLLWGAGRAAVWTGAGLCALALVLAYRLFEDVGARIRAGDYVGGVRGLATTTVIVTMLAGTAAMPAYDRQRTYRPIVDLVAAELDRGRRVALATHEAKIVGEFLFYIGRRMPLVQPVPGARAYLEAGPEDRGVVVRRDQLASVEATLQGLDYEVRRVDESAGLNARELCLITRPRRGP
jgi:4-amino-4-deoxy-L-arabinose transferase-like glycosyltransferase